MIEPTGAMSPAAPVRAITLPLTGEVISIVALSVITSTSGASSSTVWADLDMPGGDFGFSSAFADVRQLECVASHVP